MHLTHGVRGVFPHVENSCLVMRQAQASLVHVVTATGVAMGEGARRIIDSHLHVWSNGEPPFPWEVEPPAVLKGAATYEKLLNAAQRAGVSGALIVQASSAWSCLKPREHHVQHSPNMDTILSLRMQTHPIPSHSTPLPTFPSIAPYQPANHKYDHSYVTAAMRKEPDFFRGMCLANPTLPTAQVNPSHHITTTTSLPPHNSHHITPTTPLPPHHSHHTTPTTSLPPQHCSFALTEIAYGTAIRNCQC